MDYNFTKDFFALVWRVYTLENDSMATKAQITELKAVVDAVDLANKAADKRAMDRIDELKKIVDVLSGPDPDVQAAIDKLKLVTDEEEKFLAPVVEPIVA